MVKPSKWIEGTKPNQPVRKVARRAVDARLETVWHFAKLAAKKPGEDIEHVHQLRVSVRRARAALDIFEDLLPKRRARWLNKTLRGLRRAAGDARDLDVLGERLTAIAKEKEESELDKIVARIALRRRQAQKPLVKSYQKAKRARFLKRVRGLEKRIRWRNKSPEPVFGNAARATLEPLVNDFFVAGAADLSDVTNLHQLRISGKRVRYAMELLAGAFNDHFRAELYPIFAEVQELLGTINDHATAITMFTEWLERADGETHLADEMRELIAGEEAQLDATRRSFLDWWTAERAADLRVRFDAILGATASTNDVESRNGKRLPCQLDADGSENPVQVQQPTNGESQTNHRGGSSAMRSIVE